MKNIFLVLFLLKLSAYCEWSKPIQILELDTINSKTIIKKIYYDNLTRYSHIFYTNFNKEKSLSYGYHLLLDEDQNILTNIQIDEFQELYKNSENMQFMGDSRHIFVGYQKYFEKTAFFKESDDNGYSWKKGVKICNDCEFVDLIYANETGRIYAFVKNDKNMLMVSSKSLGSDIFNEPIVINKFYEVAKAAYNYWNSLILLHVIYRDANQECFHIKSRDNGISWTEPIKISNKFGCENVYQVLSHNNKGIYIIYRNNIETSPSQIVESRDFGNTFSMPKNISDNHSYNVNNQGFAYCVYKDKESLESFHIIKTAPQYAIWDIQKLEPKIKDNF